MRKLAVMLCLLVMLFSVTPTFAQVSEGGDSNSLLEVVRAELQPLAVLVLFTALGTGAWVVVEGLRALRSRNVQVFTIILDGVEYGVKISRNKIDDKLFNFFKPYLVRKEPADIDELRKEFNKLDR